MTERATQILERRTSDLITLQKEAQACRVLKDTTDKCRTIFSSIESESKRGITSLGQLHQHILAINEQIRGLEKAKSTFENAVDDSNTILPDSPLEKEQETIDLYRKYQNPLPDHQQCIDRVKPIVDSLFVQMATLIFTDVTQIAGPSLDIKKALAIAVALGSKISKADKDVQRMIKALEFHGKNIHAVEIGEGTFEGLPVFLGDRDFILSKKPELNIPHKPGLCTYLLVGGSLFAFSFVDFRAHLSLGYKINGMVTLDGSLRIVCGNATMTLFKQNEVKTEKRAFFHLDNFPEDDEKGVKLSLLLQLAMEVAQLYSFASAELKSLYSLKQEVLTAYKFEKTEKLVQPGLETWQRNLKQHPPVLQILSKNAAVFKDYQLFE